MSSKVLEACGVCKSFSTVSGDIAVLKGVNFSIEAGESVSIRGESGCGKTTLLNIVSALESPDAGDVKWSGVSVCDKSASWLAQQRASGVGLVFQSYYLLPELNALENVLLARRLVGRVSRDDRSRAQALLERVGLKDRLTHLPAKLSGGERQRVAFARALMNHPKLILADEPTGNLDEKTAEVMMDLLLSLCREDKVSLALVTHHIAFAERTDRCLFLTQGVLR